MGWRSIWTLLHNNEQNHDYVWDFIRKRSDGDIILAISALGSKVNSKEILNEVVELMNTSSIKVKEACVVALERVNENNEHTLAWKLVFEQLKLNPTKQIIFSAVRFYQQSDGELTEISDYIIELFENPNFESRHEVILAIGMMKFT